MGNGRIPHPFDRAPTDGRRGRSWHSAWSPSGEWLTAASVRSITPGTRVGEHGLCGRCTGADGGCTAGRTRRAAGRLPRSNEEPSMSGPSSSPGSPSTPRPARELFRDVMTARGPIRRMGPRARRYRGRPTAGGIRRSGQFDLAFAAFSRASICSLRFSSRSCPICRKYSPSSSCSPGWVRSEPLLDDGEETDAHLVGGRLAPFDFLVGCVVVMGADLEDRALGEVDRLLEEVGVLPVVVPVADPDQVPDLGPSRGR